LDVSNEKWGYDRGFSAGVISERSTIAAQIEQALQKEQERIAEKLAGGFLCPRNQECHQNGCKAHWMAFLEPQKNSEEATEPAGESK
jgi:hypothetical protein